MRAGCVVPFLGLLACLAACAAAAEPQPPARPDAAIAIVPLMPNASEVNDLALTPDGRFLLSQGLIGSARDGRPRLWEVATGRLLHLFEGDEAKRWDYEAWGPMAMSPALPQLAVIVATGIELWDLTTFRRTRRMAEPGFEPHSLAITRTAGSPCLAAKAGLAFGI